MRWVPVGSVQYGFAEGRVAATYVRDAVVAAVGAHGLDKREVPAEFVLRSDAVVESVEIATRESRALISARSEAEWRSMNVANLASLIAGRFHPVPGRPTLFNGVGMGWQDTVAASRALATS